MKLRNREGKTPPEKIDHFLQKLRKQGISAVNSMKKEDRQLLWSWARAVVDAYRKTLSRNSRNVRNTAELPFAKNDIQLAIKLSILPHITMGPKKMVKVLRDNYTELATFQEIAKADRKKLDGAMDSTVRQSKTKDRDRSDIYHKYIHLAAQERKRLFEDINSFIHTIST